MLNLQDYAESVNDAKNRPKNILTCLMWWKYCPAVTSWELWFITSLDGEFTRQYWPRRNLIVPGNVAS